MASDLDQLCVNTIRTLSIDAVQKANSGHPGAPMGLAAAAYTIWQKHLSHSPSNPKWYNRDRFILSNGHASMLMYSLLHLTGYDQMTMDEIKNFRQWGSKTPGHPEVGLTDGIETTTGPLGQGISTAVGMAIAEAQLRERYDGLVDHYTYGICSDGDLMEGVAAEACSLAGHLGLGKLIFIFDDNEITIDGTTEISFTEDVLKRFESYGWHVDRVLDGNDIDAIDHAINNAKKETTKPSLISLRTIIGFGSPNKANKSSSHGSPLGDEEIAKTKAAYGWNHPPFHVPKEVADHMNAVKRGSDAEAAYEKRLSSYASMEERKHGSLIRRLRGELPENWTAEMPSFDADEKGLATRASGGKVIEYIYGRLPELTGGSADLAGSTKTLHEQFGLIEKGSFNGQNIHYGVREHGMAAIANGMCLHGGLRGFGATFLVFADYMKPALRLAALSHVPSLMVFTHDSIGLGEDGPTHQPTDQLAMLRAIPNYFVFRPADANETAGCWIQALDRRSGPSCLVLTRQNVPTFDASKQTRIGDVSKGAYVINDVADASGVIIATGSEVAIALSAQKILAAKGTKVRVVSMPCWELFEAQSAEYREKILPSTLTKRIAVEAASPFGWERYTWGVDRTVAVEGFGASAPANVLFEKYGFTAENIAAKFESI